MRILHTANTYAPVLDGVAEVVRHISEELARRGHEVHVATRAVPSLPAESMVNGVHVHRFNVQGSLASGMEGDVDAFRSFVRSGHWNLMVNHCLQTWSTDALLADIGALPWPSLLVTHGLSSSDPRFAAYYRTVPRHIPRYAAWVTVSALSEEHAFAEQHFLPEPIVIRNGVDLEEWSAAPLGMRAKWKVENRFWLLNISNHSQQKRHQMFFELAGLLQGIGATCTIVGDPLAMDRWGLGRLGLKGGCFYECRMHSATSKSVGLRSSVPRGEVVSAIQEADLVVSTSRWEANSVVLLESMTAGTPWVSTDVGSARENAGGVIADSTEEMAESVIQLLQDPARRRTLGKEGQIQAAERHDWKRIADQYLQLYESVIGQRCGTGSVAAASSTPSHRRMQDRPKCHSGDRHAGNDAFSEWN